MIRTLSKKQLCIIFNLSHAGTGKYKQLRCRFFTDEALKEMDIKLERYKKVRMFNHKETILVKGYFDITPEELEEL